MRPEEADQALSTALAAEIVILPASTKSESRGEKHIQLLLTSTPSFYAK